MHQHYFTGANPGLTPATGEVLFTYILINPCDPPREVMLQWNDGTWEHRAYWGEDLISGGTNGTNSRRRMGDLPQAGAWVRLEVPASQVGLEGRTIEGMAFTLYDGQAWFDRAGKAATLMGSNISEPATMISSSTSEELESGQCPRP